MYVLSLQKQSQSRGNSNAVILKNLTTRTWTGWPLVLSFTQQTLVAQNRTLLSFHYRSHVSRV